jgi:hypothetical protein
MNTTNNQKNHVEHAAAWILKSLSTNIAWFDEIRLAGRKNFEKKYHYIPLIDISLTSQQYEITTLKDACYLLKENNDVDIYGDDFEPYGMLVQITDKGLGAFQDSNYPTGKKSFARKGLTMVAALVILASIVIGVKKTTSGDKQAKSSTPAYNKKISEVTPKTTA